MTETQEPGLDPIVQERLKRYVGPRADHQTVTTQNVTSGEQSVVAVKLEGPARIEAQERLARMQADLVKLEANVAMDPVIADQSLLDRRRQEIRDLKNQL